MKLVLANTVAFEDLEATDEAKVERVLEARMLWPFGGVQVIGEAGPGEPDWVAAAPMVDRAEDLSREAAVEAAARASVIVWAMGRGCTRTPGKWLRSLAA